MDEERVIYKGYFVDRPNRFIARVRVDDDIVVCHMPNPGRMWELLFPDVPIYVRKADNPMRKTSYDVVGIERDGVPILLDTQYNNDIAAWLIDEQAIPGWESWHVVRREVTVGNSRFDLLLGKEDELFFVEVKSCTLFSKHGAMFPDAITERGRKHLLELAAMHDEGIHTGVLFLVHWDRATWFLPDYHTDTAFADTFAESAPKLDWKALALRWDSRFTKPVPIRTLDYPSHILQQENHDGGDYMVVLELTEDQTIPIGALGPIAFPKGYYVYVGSAKKNLAARLARHQRKRKRLHWHIDYLRQHSKVVAAIPVRTTADLEHEIAGALSQIAQWQIPGFGCTDCTCSSHLFGFKSNPIHEKSVMQLVEDVRMNRLDDMVVPK